MQQHLPLARAAHGIARLAMLSHLRDMPPHRLPAADLASILAGHPPAHEIAAIPLEPAARVVGMNSALVAADR
jgi:hypothetical protein